MCIDIAALSLEDIDSVSSVGRDRDTVGPLPRSVIPSWGMPYMPSRPYTGSYLSPITPVAAMSYGPPATPYNFVNDSVSYVSMPGMNGAESVASGTYTVAFHCCCVRLFIGLFYFNCWAGVDHCVVKLITCYVSFWIVILQFIDCISKVTSTL